MYNFRDSTHMSVGSFWFGFDLFIIEGGSDCSGQCLIIFNTGRTRWGWSFIGSGWSLRARSRLWFSIQWGSYSKSQCFILWLRTVKEMGTWIALHYNNIISKSCNYRFYENFFCSAVLVALWDIMILFSNQLLTCKEKTENKEKL